jgi:hypothetical protein
MAILKQRLNRKNDNGTYDTVYLENIATNVKMSETDSTTVATAINNRLPLSGGTLTGNLTGQFITGTWLRTTDATNRAGDIATISSEGWIYKRTPAEIRSDIGAQPAGSYATTAQLNEVKTSVSNGKSAVASAITDKGVSTSATASFNTMASNIRKIGMIVPAALPAGYTACNYIQTDGNAWINTGIDLTSNTQYLNEIFVSSSFPSTAEAGGPLLSAINADRDSSIYISQSCQLRYNNYYSNFNCGGRAGSVGSGIPLYHMAEGKINYYIGLTRTSGTVGKPCRWGTKELYDYSNNESRYSIYKAVIYLWKYGYNQASGTAGGAIPGSKIYEFLYYYNNELKSHMIPCRSSGGMVGLYDVVRNAFYGNNGTGLLTYG